MFYNKQPGNRNGKCTVKTAAAEFRALCKRVRLLFWTESEEPQHFDAFSRTVTGMFICYIITFLEKAMQSNFIVIKFQLLNFENTNAKRAVLPNEVTFKNLVNTALMKL